MALIKCPECGKEISDKAASCPNCGCPLIVSAQPSSPSAPVNNAPIPQTPKKKGPGCLVILLVVVALIGLIYISGENYLKNSGANYSPQEDASEIVPEQSNVTVVLDATQFIVDDSRTVSEAELIAILGEPDLREEWNHNTPTLSYPIVTLEYGNYRYNFNNDMLKRISVDGEEIPYTDKDDILAMFGLKKYANSAITDTGFAYRVKNCGVYDFWVAIMDEDSLDSIRISYNDLFEQ